MESLVGLRALDVVRLLASQGSFEIGNYGKPICTVVNWVNDIQSLNDAVSTLCNRLNADYILVKKPHSQGELARLYKELERVLNEG